MNSFNNSDTLNKILKLKVGEKTTFTKADAEIVIERAEEDVYFIEVSGNKRSPETFIASKMILSLLLRHLIGEGDLD